VINTWQFSFIVIYWTNQSKAEHSKLSCDLLAKLRPGWRQAALYTALQTAEHVYTESQSQTLGKSKCVHKSRQDNCNSLSFDQVKKNQKWRCPYFPILMVPCFLKMFITSNIELARTFPSLSMDIFVQLEMFLHMPIG
jgi:hypothetical protein